MSPAKSIHGKRSTRADGAGSREDAIDPKPGNTNMDTSEQFTPAKRKRVAKACKQCRSRKVRCDGNEPVCGQCLATDQTCVYTDSKRRGLPAGYVQQLGGYARKLEQLLGLMLGSDQGQLLLSQCVRQLKNTGPEELQGYENNWKSSKLCVEFNDIVGFDVDTGSSVLQNTIAESIQAVENLDDSVSSPFNPSMVHQGNSIVTSSDFKIESNNLSELDNHVVDTSVHVPNDLSGHGFEIISTRSLLTLPTSRPYIGESSGYSARFRPDIPFLYWRSSSGDLESWISSIPISKRLHLLNSYFSYVHCWLPMLSKMDLVRSAHIQDPFQRGEGHGLLLTSVILLSSCMTHEMTTDIFPLVQILTAQIGQTSASITKVQTIIINSLILLGIGNWNDSWDAIGCAVHTAYHLGIHTFKPEISDLSRRAWYSCCILETLISSKLGRLPHVCDGDFDVEALNEDEWEEWELSKPYPEESTSTLPENLQKDPWCTQPVRSISVFNVLFRLVSFLNSLISKINQPNFRERDRIRISIVYNELLNRLHQWVRGLPDHCRLDDLQTRVITPLPLHITNLYLVFTTTIILLHSLGKTVSRETTSSNGELLYEQEVLPEITLKLLTNLTARIKHSKTPPLFEYFTSVSLELLINRLKKTSRNDFRFQNDSSNAIQLYNNLENFSQALGGRFISKDYFTEKFDSAGISMAHLSVTSKDLEMIDNNLIAQDMSAARSDYNANSMTVGDDLSASVLTNSRIPSFEKFDWYDSQYSGNSRENDSDGIPEFLQNLGLLARR